jgi:hypothetical protein
LGAGCAIDVDAVAANGAGNDVAGRPAAKTPERRVRIYMFARAL